MNILLLRITLTVTLLCTFTATLIIRLLAIEEMDIWGLSINGVIMMGSISLLFCLWSEDISSWTMLMRTGGILSILEIFLLGVFIAACASEKPYQMEEYLVFSILSLLPIRVVYFIPVIAGKKAMEMGGE